MAQGKNLSSCWTGKRMGSPPSPTLPPPLPHLRLDTMWPGQGNGAEKSRINHTYLPHATSMQGSLGEQGERCGEGRPNFILDEMAEAHTANSYRWTIIYLTSFIHHTPCQISTHHSPALVHINLTR